MQPILPPLKPIPMKDRISVVCVERRNLDVLDGAFVVVAKTGGPPLQQSQYSLQALLYGGHLIGGEARERTVAEAVSVECTGLIDDDLTGLEQPVSWGNGYAPALEGWINLSG